MAHTGREGGCVGKPTMELQGVLSGDRCRTAWASPSQWLMFWSLHIWFFTYDCMSLGKSLDFSVPVSSFVRWGLK